MKKWSLLTIIRTIIEILALMFILISVSFENASKVFLGVGLGLALLDLILIPVIIKMRKDD